MTITFTRGSRSIIIPDTHLDYGADVLNNFDGYFDTIESDGVLDFTGPFPHALRGVGEFWFSGFPESPEISRCYADLLKLKQGDVVVDAGAYCGLSSFVFAGEVGSAGRVIAIEPDKQNIECFMKNLSGVGVALYPMALWSEKGYIEFNGEGNLGSSISGLTLRKSSEVVPTISLDDLGLEKVDAIKLDIEGAEFFILDSLERFLNKYRPNLVMEIHPKGGIYNEDMIVSVLNKCGYCHIFYRQDDSIFPLIAAYPS